MIDNAEIQISAWTASSGSRQLEKHSLTWKENESLPITLDFGPPIRKDLDLENPIVYEGKRVEVDIRRGFDRNFEFTFGRLNDPDQTFDVEVAWRAR